MCIQRSNVLMQFKVKFLYGSFLKWTGFEENNSEVITHAAALVKSELKLQWLNHYECIMFLKYWDKHPLFVLSPFLVIFPYYPDCIPMPYFLISAICALFFPLFFPHFFPIPIFLAFGIGEDYFSSIASEGILSLPLSERDQSCPVFCNLHYLSILLSYFCHW